MASNSTVILDDQDEPQPDLVMRIPEERGGRSRITRHGFIEGAPELVAEVAYSSRAIDLHLKRERYQLSGVIECVVLRLEPKKIYWFDLRHGKKLQPDAEGVFRPRIFPGSRFMSRAC